jgi:phospholipid/cholesterol/gamma-HCH transport system permease protein
MSSTVPDPIGRRRTTQAVEMLERSPAGVLMERTGRTLMKRMQVAGRACLLFFDACGHLSQAGRSGPMLVRLVEMAGVGSVMVLSLIAFLTGTIMALQTGTELERIGSDLVGNLGAIIGATFVRELGPIWAAVIILARVGGAMAAELGTMAVNEEVDALRAMSIDPRRYLVMPRLMALMLSMPALAMIANIVGIAGGMLVGATVFNVSTQTFLDNMQANLQAMDVFGGLMKSVVFGAIIGAIACDQGLNTTDGAEGVGRSTTKSVVLNVLFILIADLVLTWFVQAVVEPAFA